RIPHANAWRFGRGGQLALFTKFQLTDSHSGVKVIGAKKNFSGRNHMKVTSLLALVAVLLAGGHLLYGQGTARIVGVVSDAGGGLVPNAQVTLINEATGLRETA